MNVKILLEAGMRFGSYYGFLWLLTLAGCKAQNSGLKVTQEQRADFRGCIISTVMESFASSNPDRDAVAAFAQDMVTRAPSANGSADDAAFEEYAEGLGCDPKKMDERNNAGLLIVAEWSISPMNPDVPED